jgi:predicted TIM-barrel fold metal-dependent hydrolase
MKKRRIVDAHHHLWDLTTSSNYPWLQGAPSSDGMLGDLTSIQRSYLLPEYLTDTSSYELVQSVHVEAVPEDAIVETRWLQSIADKNGFPLGIVAHVELNHPKAEAALAAQFEFANIRGVRQILNWHANSKFTFTPNDLLTDGKWLTGFGLLKKYNLSFDLQLYPGQMSKALKLAQKYPETLIVINHAGMPVDRDPDGIKLWQSGMKCLAAAHNIVVKISGLGMVDHNWTTESIRPFVRNTIEEFGIDRVMFGSNFPVDKIYSSFDTLYTAFEQIVVDFDEAEKDKLFRANALGWYRLSNKDFK